MKLEQQALLVLQVRLETLVQLEILVLLVQTEAQALQVHKVKLVQQAQTQLFLDLLEKLELQAQQELLVRLEKPEQQELLVILVLLAQSARLVRLV